MDKLKKNTNKMQLCSLVRETTAKLPLDCPVTLPEYFGDLVKILKCTVTPVASSVSCSAGRVTAEGVCHIRILYTAENGGIYTFETGEPFSRYVDAADCDGCNVVDYLWAEGVSCRAVGPRKMEVHALVQMYFKMYGKVSREILNSCEGAGVQLLPVSYHAEMPVNTAAKKLTVSESRELPAGKPDADRILSVSAAAVLNETKAIPDKIMLKGEITQTVLYAPENGDSLPEQAVFTIPFSEIAEVPGITESTRNQVDVHVISADALLKPQASGKMRSVDNTVCLQAVISCASSEDFNAYADAYSTEYEVKLTGGSLHTVTQSVHSADHLMLDGEFDLADLSAGSLLSHDCQCETARTSVTDGAVTVSGTVVFGLLLKTEAGSAAYAQRSLDYTFEKKTDGDPAQVQFQPAVTVFASSAVLKEGKVSVRVELFIEGELETGKDVYVLSDIQVDESKPKQKEAPGMIVCFAEKGESVWNLAKKYNTSPAALSEDNQLKEDILSDKQTLLISCV